MQNNKKKVNEAAGTAYDSLSRLVDDILSTAYQIMEKKGTLEVSFTIPMEKLMDYSKRLGSVLSNGLTVNTVESSGGETNADVDIAKGDIRLFIPITLAPVESNRVYRDGNFDILAQIKKLYSKDVLHELTHCLNGLTKNGYQNITPDAMKSDVYEEASALLYLFSETEMNARVSQVYDMLVRQINEINDLTKNDFINASKVFVYGEDAYTRFNLNTSIYGMKRSIGKVMREQYANYLTSINDNTANDLVSYLLTFGENELNVKKYQLKTVKNEKLPDGDTYGLFKVSQLIKGEQSFNVVRDDIVNQFNNILIKYQTRLNKVIVRAYQEFLENE